MVWVQARTDENHLFLTEGYVPSLQDLRKIYPQRPRYEWAAKYEPKDDPDRAVAWIVAAYTQVLTLYPYPSFPSLPPLETWLIGPPNRQDSELAEWFASEPPETNYRVFLHKQPNYHEGIKLFYGHFGATHIKLGIRHRKGKCAHLKRLSKPFLEEMVRAYDHSPEAVETRIAKIDHPFAFSKGLPLSRRRPMVD